MPATIEEAAAIAMELPGVSEEPSWGSRAWKVGKKMFAWDRPFSKADLRRFGDAPVPTYPILAVRVDDLGEKEAVLAAGHKGVFTIQHFDGYPAVLVELKLVGKRVLRELITDAWAAVAPVDLVADHRPRR